MDRLGDKAEPAIAAPVLSCLQGIVSEDLAARLARLRWDLHQYPELSFKEERTSNKLYEALEALRPLKLDRIAGTAVVARIAGRDRKAPTVAIRGDIDALPIEEDTGLEWASRHPGVMHACGHDVHASWAVGAAHLLSERPAEGDVLVVLQPAEETGQGALAVLENGILDRVWAIFGAHVDRRFAVGEVVAQEGPIGASADFFSVVYKGAGAHGARPHEGRDPVVGAGALISALQTIVSRRVNPADPAVVTIGTIEGGTAANIIPDRVKLTGTLRATEHASRQVLHDEVNKISEAIAQAHGLEAEVSIAVGTPPVINPAQPTAWAQSAVSAILGKTALTPMGRFNMGGEDFAFYLERIPGCFMRIGAREPGGKVISAHSSGFYAAMESLYIGAAVLAETARRASADLAAGKRETGSA